MRHSSTIRSRLWSVCTLVLLLILTLSFGTAQAEKGGKGKGAAGGQGYVDTGSAEYLYSYSDPLYDFGFIPDVYSLYEPYCHGVDGQVTLKARFIQDLDVYNENERWLAVIPGCCDDGSCGLCDDVESPYGGTLPGNFEIGFLGTYRKAYGPDNYPYHPPNEPSYPYYPLPFGEGDRYGERELDFRRMAEGEIWRATMRFDLGRKKPLLLFGHKGYVGSSALCGYPPEEMWEVMLATGYSDRWEDTDHPGDDSTQVTASEPVWVSCDRGVAQGANEPKTPCLEWTVSTYALSFDNQTLVVDYDNFVRGCLAYSWVKGAPLTVQRDVEANFLIKVKYIEKGADCP